MARTTQPDDNDIPLAELAARVADLLTTKAGATLATKGHPAMRASHASALAAVGLEPLADKTIGELAQALDVSQQAASKVVVELEALGYAERIAAEHDRRMTRVALTRAGRAWLSASRRAHAALETKLAAKTSARAIAQARATLVKVLAALT